MPHYIRHLPALPGELLSELGSSFSLGVFPVNAYGFVYVPSRPSLIHLRVYLFSIFSTVFMCIHI
ncbi:hypothetical protein PISMIDRAFT_673939 [Pisolithus microcarpus 441]|uniref:Unplaced genomic scaffold scaffold_9, whole genome shotgun sequence n=1 Tax=Pisolithus microcarpus 441 TaxID=765257 RepID=A0A0C9ZG10_9AGAM|nr:hypothetical protein PISMIDRAFT_673939 [Pisolithus microcarpus 441]